jgi:hypothetical protein
MSPEDAPPNSNTSRDGTALLNSEGHALTVGVGHLQHHVLGHAQLAPWATLSMA